MPDGMLDAVRRLIGMQDADGLIREMPTESYIMLNERFCTLKARLATIPRAEAAPPARGGTVTAMAVGAGPQPAEALAADPDDEDAAIRAAIHAEIRGVIADYDEDLRQGGGQLRAPNSPTWNDLLRCEQLMVYLLSLDALRPFVAERLNTLSRVDPRRHEALSAQWDAAAAEGALDAARSAAVSILQVIQKRNMQRFLRKRLGLLYASRLVTVFLMVMALGLALVLWEVHFDSWPLTRASFSGFTLTLCAGIMGASFSTLTGQGAIVATTDITEVRTATGYQMIFLRLGVGVGAAAVLYFFFESGLLEGQLFPRLERIGFQRVEAVGGPGVLAENANYGTSVPNADLSKLVVWSFLAGFSEKLVPTLLNRVKASDDK